MAVTISDNDIDAAIINYLPRLDKEQKTALLGIMKVFTPVPGAGGYWDDPLFVAEIDSRYEDYKNGRVKANTLEEFIAAGRESIEDVRNKKSGNEA